MFVLDMSDDKMTEIHPLLDRDKSGGDAQLHGDKMGAVATAATMVAQMVRVFLMKETSHFFFFFSRSELGC